MTQSAAGHDRDPAPVTVLVVGYNHARFMVACLESIRVQTVSPARVVIADDASGDDTDRVVRKYLAEHPGFAEYRPNSVNTGLTRTLNALLADVDTEFVTYIAADDYMLPQRLEAHVALLSSTTHALAYSDAIVVDEDGHVLAATSREAFPWPDEPARSTETFALLLRTNWIPAASFFLRTADLVAAGGYCEELYYEDLELLIRLSAQGRTFGYVEAPLVAVRRVATSLGTETFRSENPRFVHSLDVALRHYEGAEPSLAAAALSRRWELAKRLARTRQAPRRALRNLWAARRGAASRFAALAHLARAAVWAMIDRRVE